MLSRGGCSRWGTVARWLLPVDVPTLGRSLPDAAQEPSPRRCWRRRDHRCGRGDGVLIRRRQDSARCAENRSRDSGPPRKRASAFEDVHSVTETPASILAAVTALAAASSVHPDDCVAVIKAHALRRSDCYTWRLHVLLWAATSTRTETRPPSPLNGSREPASAWSMRTCVGDGGRATRSRFRRAVERGSLTAVFSRVRPLAFVVLLTPAPSSNGTRRRATGSTACGAEYLGRYLDEAGPSLAGTWRRSRLCWPSAIC